MSAINPVKVNTWLLSVLLMAATLALYWPAAHFGYVWDDGDILLRSAKYNNWGNLFDTLIKPFLNSQNYFRPLPIFTLAVEQIFSGGSASVSHVVAVLIHVANSALVLMLAAAVVKSRGGSNAAAWGLLAGCFFALHPADIESVAWISCRFELLVTLFIVSALLADIGFENRGCRAAAVSILFFLAALCKEMAVTLCLALPLWHLFLAARTETGPRAAVRAALRKHWLTYAAVFVAGLAYLFLRLSALENLLTPDPAKYERWTLTHFYVVMKTLGQLVHLAFWPFTQLSPLHPLDLPPDWADSEFLLGLAAAFGAAVLALLNLTRRPGPTLLLLCFVVSLFPVLNIIPLNLGDNFTAERFLYLPLVFLALGLTELVRGLSIPAVSLQLKLLLAVLLGGGWLLISAGNIRVTLPLWSDDLHLWRWGYMRAPDSVTAQMNLQAAYLGRGMNEEAIAFSMEVLRREGASVNEDVFRGLVLALAMQGYSVAQALEPLRRQIAQRYPDNVNNAEATGARNLLGWLFLMSGDLPHAEQWLQHAMRDDPLYMPAAYALSVLYKVQGNQTAADEMKDRWMKHARSDDRVRFSESYDLLAGRYAEAAAKFTAAEKRASH